MIGYLQVFAILCLCSYNLFWVWGIQICRQTIDICPLVAARANSRWPPWRPFWKKKLSNLLEPNFFFMFLGSENMILTLFLKSEFKNSLSCQIKDFFTFFDVKIGIFLKITVKRTQFVTVYQNFGYNMFV